MNEIFNQLQEFRKILCICPCCGYFYRISDLHLKVKGRWKKTWLDSYEHRYLELEKLEDKFEATKKELKERAREKGRVQAEKAFTASITPSFRKLRINPFDIKPIFYPVDFLVFKGMEREEEIDNLIFLSKLNKSAHIHEVRKQVNNVITSQDYEWKEGKIDEKGNIQFK